MAVNFSKNTTLPVTLEANTVYFISSSGNSDLCELHITGSTNSVIKRTPTTADIASQIEAALSSVSSDNFINQRMLFDSNVDLPNTTPSTPVGEFAFNNAGKAETTKIIISGESTKGKSFFNIVIGALTFGKDTLFIQSVLSPWVWVRYVILGPSVEDYEGIYYRLNVALDDANGNSLPASNGGQFTDGEEVEFIWNLQSFSGIDKTKLLPPSLPANAGKVPMVEVDGTYNLGVPFYGALKSGDNLNNLAIQWSSPSYEFRALLNSVPLVNGNKRTIYISAEHGHPYVVVIEQPNGTPSGYSGVFTFTSQTPGVGIPYEPPNSTYETGFTVPSGAFKVYMTEGALVTIQWNPGFESQDSYWADKLVVKEPFGNELTTLVTKTSLALDLGEKENYIAPALSSDYYFRGDKTWQLFPTIESGGGTDSTPVQIIATTSSLPVQTGAKINLPYPRFSILSAITANVDCSVRFFNQFTDPFDIYADSVALNLLGEGLNNSLDIVDVNFPSKLVNRFGDTKISTTTSISTLSETPSVNLIDSSIYFDGSGDYLTLDTIAVDPDYGLFGRDYTVEFWAYPLTTSQQYIIGNLNDATGTTSWHIIINGAFGGLHQLQVFASNCGAQYKVGDGVNFPANSWTHVAVSKQGSNIKVFVNGTLGGTLDWSGINAGPTTNLFTIGACNNNGTVNRFPFYGYMSNIRLTKGIARYSSNFDIFEVFYETQNPFRTLKKYDLTANVLQDTGVVLYNKDPLETTLKALITNKSNSSTAITLTTTILPIYGGGGGITSQEVNDLIANYQSVNGISRASLIAAVVAGASI
jgi:hypothetical protein